jgi:hypothetical protein
MAPRNNIIFSAGDPTTIVEDLLPMIEIDVTSDLLQSVVTVKGTRFVAANIKRQAKWRHFSFYIRRQKPRTILSY